MDEAEALPIADLLDERRYLLEVAFGMLGSAPEAERVVDEVYRLWYGLSHDARREIVRPRSWLAGAASRSCWNRPSDTGEDVGEVADGVGRGEPECAEPAERARAGVRVRRARPASAREQDAVVRSVVRACASGDDEALTALLCADAVAFFDGGGKVRALDRPVHGSRPVARALLTLLAHGPRTAMSAQSVNGRTGLVVRYERRVAAVLSLDVADHHVAQVWVVLNPDKLRSWNRLPGPRTR